MTKIKPLIVTFESFDNFIERTSIALEKAIETGVPSIQRKDTRIWSSVENYQKFMSDQKYAILAAIYKHKPRSVYELANILGRAQQNVARDCEGLADHKFIRFRESKRGRKVKAPMLSFDYNAVLVCLPSVTYKVEFDVAA